MYGLFTYIWVNKPYIEHLGVVFHPLYNLTNQCFFSLLTSLGVAATSVQPRHEDDCLVSKEPRPICFLPPSCGSCFCSKIFSLSQCPREAGQHEQWKKLWLVVSLGIQSYSQMMRWLGFFPITETKRKVFRFHETHETILRFGELIGSL